MIHQPHLVWTLHSKSAGCLCWELRGISRAVLSSVPVGEWTQWRIHNIFFNLCILLSNVTCCPPFRVWYKRQRACIAFSKKMWLKFTCQPHALCVSLALESQTLCLWTFSGFWKLSGECCPVLDINYLPTNVLELMYLDFLLECTTVLGYQYSKISWT